MHDGPTKAVLTRQPRNVGSVERPRRTYERARAVLGRVGRAQTKNRIRAFDPLDLGTSHDRQLEVLCIFAQVGGNLIANGIAVRIAGKGQTRKT